MPSPGPFCLHDQAKDSSSFFYFLYIFSFFFFCLIFVVFFAMPCTVAHLHFGSVKLCIRTWRSYCSAVSQLESGCLQVLSPAMKKDIVADLMCGCGQWILDKISEFRCALRLLWCVDSSPPSSLNCNEVYSGTK